MNDKVLNQGSTGSGSAYQAAGNMTINGMTYADTKELALDLWRDNTVKLSQIASQTAMNRINEFLDLFLTKLNERNPALFHTMKQPSMQMTLFSAQTNYVKTGDVELAELLELLLAKSQVLA